MPDFVIILSGSLCLGYTVWATAALVCAARPAQDDSVRRGSGRALKLRLDRRRTGRRAVDRRAAREWVAASRHGEPLMVDLYRGLDATSA